ncbi:hypothetical protein G6514_007386 [Epicoccum nigrum]|nr:hypothetical protein G6514_007386 [Epicoccum nigrum]
MIRLPCKTVYQRHYEPTQPVSDLCDKIRTMDDLIALVDSVADDLDLDLDVRPSAEDDSLFNNAPFDDLYETPMEVSVTETVEEVASGEIDPRGDSWLGRVVSSIMKQLVAAPRLGYKGVGIPGGYVED